MKLNYTCSLDSLTAVTAPRDRGSQSARGSGGPGLMAVLMDGGPADGQLLSHAVPRSRRNGAGLRHLSLHTSSLLSSARPSLGVSPPPPPFIWRPTGVCLQSAAERLSRACSARRHLHALRHTRRVALGWGERERKPLTSPTSKVPGK